MNILVHPFSICRQGLLWYYYYKYLVSFCFLIGWFYSSVGHQKAICKSAALIHTKKIDWFLNKHCGSLAWGIAFWIVEVYMTIPAGLQALQPHNH